MTDIRTINFIYFGTYASTDVFERDTFSERAGLLEGASSDFRTLEIVPITTVDRGHDGAVDDDETRRGDTFTYARDGRTVTAESDSTMTFRATVTTADGAERSVDVLVVQATNGDVFVSDLLNRGTLDNLSIRAITLDDATGSNFSGFFTNQSVDGTTIALSGDPLLAESDGIVEGGDGADLIDAGFAGDPGGDRIDAGDARFGAVGSDDDVVAAGAGDDTVAAGAGDDSVYGSAGGDEIAGGAGDDLLVGQAGDDTLAGGAGDDTLRGDGAVEITGRGPREVFEWREAPDFANNVPAAGFTQDTGSVSVTFGIDEQSIDSVQDTDDAILHRYEVGGQNVDGLEPAISNRTSFESISFGFGNVVNYTFDFDAAVGDVTFRINDLDTSGRVTVVATGPNGPVEVELSTGANVSLSPDGQTATSTGGNLADTAAQYSVNVAIAGPVTSIVVQHAQISDEASGINITDIGFAPVTLAPGAGGDDSLSGEAGDDVLDGGAGDDTLAGGTGRDTLTGGAGADAIDGGDDADVIRGGGAGDSVAGGEGGAVVDDASQVRPGVSADFDTLDLTGLDVRLDDLRPDANGNGFDGTVTFLDTGGVPTGESFEFTGIERIAGLSAGPVAGDDVARTDEDTPLRGIDVLANDGDPDAPASQLSVAAAVAGNGQVTLNADGTIDYVPDPDFNGVDTITYTVRDADGNTDTAQVRVSVDPVPDAPEAVDDRAATDENQAVVIDLLGNDRDPDLPDDALRIVELTQPATGSVVDNGDGTVTFTPNRFFAGEARFDYTVADLSGRTDTATAIVDVADTIRPDGIVSNGTGDALIDARYAGDPEGDRIDANDAVLGDVGSNDDIVAAGAGNDTVLAGAGDDTVRGEDGEDSIRGGEGADSLAGDGGRDTIFGEAGRDTLAGGAEDDLLDGGADDDRIEGGDGDDTLLGGAGADTILGGTGNDSVRGGSGDDSIEGGDGNDTVASAGEGDDTVLGEAGDDLLSGGAGNDSLSGGTGADALFGDDGRDTLVGGSGADTLSGGADGDTIFGGDDADRLLGGSGADAIDGGAGGDFIDASAEGAGSIDVDVPFLTPPDDQDADPSDDRDTVTGGAGDDTIFTGDDADYIDAGDGADSVVSGIDDDTVLGGAGNDTIRDIQGADVIFGGDGDDLIDAGTDTLSDFAGDQPTLDGRVPNPFAASGDPNPDDGRDYVDGGAGNDTIRTGDDADTILGGTGADSIDAGIDNDVVAGGADDDLIIGGHGADTLEGEGGNDTIYGGYGTTKPPRGVVGSEPDATDPSPENGRDVIRGGDGNDVLYGEDDDDLLEGGADDDRLDGGDDDDTLLGGDGADTLAGGQGDDSLDGGAGADLAQGGADRDTFTGAAGGDTVLGGSAGDDFDTLDLRGTLDGGSYAFVGGGPRPDSDGNGLDGEIEFFDAGGVSTGILSFENIENIIPCFTPGTLIATPQGERRVETLREGDRVITRDNGIQPIAWAGSKTLDAGALAAQPELAPVLIRQGALGHGLPERDMWVSPNHRMLIANDRAALYFEEREVLAAAKHLVDGAGIEQAAAGAVTYVHFMFVHHEVVLADGAWSESFQPGHRSLRGIEDAQRGEILRLFPELEAEEGVAAYGAARRTLKRHEARLLVE